MNIDVKTGLPELPEGYYWEIRERMYKVDQIFGHTFFPLQVSVCTRHKKWFSTRVVRISSSLMMEGETIFNYTVVEATTENILKYAEEALIEFERASAHQSAIGEYPPKKLKGSK